MTSKRLLLLLALGTLAACGRTFLDDAFPDAAAVPPPPDAGPPPVPAKTTLDPLPGPFNGEVEVTAKTDKPATLYFTLDSSDPRTSATRRWQDTPVKITFQQTTTFSFYSHTAEGADEDSRSVVYVRAGGPKGTVSGVVVVDGNALNQPVGIAADLSVTMLGTPTKKEEMPFSIEGFGTGTHQLVPFADLNGDGTYIPFLDMGGKTFSFTLDLTDPAKSSIEGVKLYLGTSQPGLCTLRGNVTFPAPVPNQNLSVAALDPNMLQGTTDPQTLLTAFSQGYRVTTNATDTVYPYEILDLAPGNYMPVPALIGILGGLSLNLVADLNGTRNCPAGGVATADFKFGQVSLTGTVTYTPPATTFYAWGAVVARNITLSGGSITAQVILMPTILFPSGTTDLQGGFTAVALLDDQSFDLRAFTNLDAGGGNPFAAAFAWAMNPFSPLPSQGHVIAKPPSVTATVKAP